MIPTTVVEVFMNILPMYEKLLTTVVSELTTVVKERSGEKVTVTTVVTFVTTVIHCRFTHFQNLSSSFNPPSRNVA